MTETPRKRKPGRDHLIPEPARHLRSEKHVSTEDWKNARSYTGHEKWTNARWAWEFLRRNRFFQQDCDAFEASRKRGKSLPSRWRLHPFKSYSEPFEGTGLSPPRWSIFSQVEIWDTNTPLRLTRPQSPLHVDDFTLQPGQIAFVLDLNDAGIMPQLLHAQWASAWYKMASSAARLRAADAKQAGNEDGSLKAPSKSVKRLPMPHKDKLIDYLRIADAFSLHYPATMEEVCEQLHVDGRLQASADKRKSQASSPLVMVKAKNSLYKMIEASRHVIYDRGYLLLLAEQARDATWQEMVAPYWPYERTSLKNKNKSAEPNAWTTPEEDEIAPASPFSGLFRRTAT